jgi:photosystem II stability/assembly factor-like uncharacterized protein
VIRYPVQRALAVLVMASAVAALLQLRVTGSPEIELYRTAMAAAPEAGLYAALAGRRLVEVAPDGRVRSSWQLPAGTPLSLAASGDNLVLGTDRGLHLSVNRGRTWVQVRSSGRFGAVALRGKVGYAGAWAQGLWSTRDGGESWSQARTPEGDTDYESIAIADSAVVVATLLGALVSADGAVWTRASLPSRMTAVDASGGDFLAGAWRGQLFRSADGRDWSRAGGVPGGIWAVSGLERLVATTEGLFPEAGPATALRGREVTALTAVDGVIYAAVARGPIMVSTDGGRAWQVAIKR